MPAQLGGDQKNWLLLRKRDGSGRAAERREYRPMLATLADDLPTRRRAGCSRSSGTATARSPASAAARRRSTSRNGNDLTERFAQVARGAAARRCARPTACSTARCARSTSAGGRASRRCSRRAGHAIVYYVFDLLELEGEPLVDLPLAERRARLEALLDRRARRCGSPASFDDGEALLAAASEQGLEGVMAKRPTSRYLPGRREPRLAQDQAHGRARSS